MGGIAKDRKLSLTSSFAGIGQDVWPGKHPSSAGVGGRSGEKRSFLTRARPSAWLWTCAMAQREAGRAGAQEEATLERIKENEGGNGCLHAGGYIVMGRSLPLDEAYGLTL